MSKSRFYFPSSINEKKLDKMVSSLYNNLYKALDIAVPKIVIKNLGKSFHWYTEEHENLSKKVNKLYVRAMKTRKSDDYLAYKAENKIYSRKCRKDRNRSWKKYIDGIRSAKEVSRLTKLLNSAERNSVNVFDNPDGSLTEPGSETLEALLKTHFKSSFETPHNKYSSANSLSTREIALKYKDWLSMEKIIAALDDFEKKKSP